MSDEDLPELHDGALHLAHRSADIFGRAEGELVARRLPAAAERRVGARPANEGPPGQRRGAQRARYAAAAQARPAGAGMLRESSCAEFTVISVPGARHPRPRRMGWIGAEGYGVHLTLPQREMKCAPPVPGHLRDGDIAQVGARFTGVSGMVTT